MFKKILFTVILLPSITFSICLKNKINKPTVLVGAIVSQKPKILQQFLKSLKELETNNCAIEYYLLDENSLQESQELLQQSFQGKKNYNIVSKKETDAILSLTISTDPYDIDEINKIAKLKDHILQYALKYNYDYLFLIDSPLVFHPKTLDQLISNNKDIVANIFWNKEISKQDALPQVWLSDQASLFSLGDNEITKKFTMNEIETRSQAFIDKLKRPGLYEVGGLANCILLSKKAINMGVNYRRIQNLTFWREDVHFCLRAEALKLPLYVDTHYPASLLGETEQQNNQFPHYYQ